MTYEEIKKKYPEDFRARDINKYTYRYSNINYVMQKLDLNLTVLSS